VCERGNTDAGDGIGPGGKENICVDKR